MVINMERVDVYDREGNLTGKVIARGESLEQGEYLLAVGIWIADGENNLLLTKRSMEKQWAPGKWENTAGHVQSGEGCVHAILRELQEETGLEVEESQLAYLGSACWGHYMGENYGVRLQEHPKALTFQEGETCGAKWVTPEQLAEMGRTGQLSPSVLTHLEGGYLRGFLKFIGREGCDLFGKDEGP